MKKTLMHKVNLLEKETEERITQVQQERKDQLADLKIAEEKVIDNVRNQAEEKGQKIVTEIINQVKNEINLMKQDRESAVKAVKNLAESNKVNATVKTVSLFKEKYLSDK